MRGLRNEIEHGFPRRKYDLGVVVLGHVAQSVATQFVPNLGVGHEDARLIGEARHVPLCEEAGAVLADDVA